jgi:RNA polymerase sigma-70 factor (ECF subfamily)
MGQEPSFDVLLDRLRRGDASAPDEIFRRFAYRLIGLARQRLDARVRQKVDPEDVVLSAFKSFFLRHAQQEFELDSWDSLWTLLTVITLRKCGHQTRHFHAAAHDVRREVTPVGGADDSSASWQAIARDPTPAEATLLADTVQQLFDSLNANGRRIIELALEGYKTAEIAARVGRAERTVYRTLERVKGRLERLRVEERQGG